MPLLLDCLHGRSIDQCDGLERKRKVKLRLPVVYKWVWLLFVLGDSSSRCSYNGKIPGVSMFVSYLWPHCESCVSESALELWEETGVRQARLWKDTYFPSQTKRDHPRTGRWQSVKWMCVVCRDCWDGLTLSYCYLTHISISYRRVQLHLSLLNMLTWRKFTL